MWSPCYQSWILTAEGDMDAAQRGIVYIDEIDKIQRSGSGFKDLRLGVQHALLKLLEDTIATMPPQGGFKHPAQPGVPFDTTNVLFICGGAFVGLEDIIAKRLGRGGFGFGQVSENRQVASDGLLRQVKPEDLEQFGLIPEIILTFRTFALDYPRISFGAKLRGAVRYRRSSARWLDAVTERQLP